MITPKALNQTLADIKTADAAALRQLRVDWLGRKGLLTKALREIGQLPAPKRAAAGKAANAAKVQLEAALKLRERSVMSAAIVAAGKASLDITAPGGGPQFGHLHPLKQLQKELTLIFWQLGFEMAEGPEIETDWYNFEALNIPADHPARDMMDTFYLENGAIARTHTSSVQIRYMETHPPPIRIVSMGTVHRNEDEDQTHLAVFKQIEGLVVDEGVSLAHLKGTLLHMVRSLLGKDLNIRLAPSYFPFVEPALEVHITCVTCRGKGLDCRTCKGTGWIELGGSGMVHPKVLANLGIDPKRYSGFAFGFGVERFVMMKYQLDDIRHLWRPDLRFLEQF